MNVAALLPGEAVRLVDAAEVTEKLSPGEMLEQFREINVCAPMVRYSKLAFRQLVSQYNCHITTTPMMLAKEFVLSSDCRDAEFTTNSQERGTFMMEESSTPSWTGSSKPYNCGDSNIVPIFEVSNQDHVSDQHFQRRKGRTRKVRGALIAQFAANDPFYLSKAAEMVSQSVDGVDINCGCPQTWAYRDGVGCALLRKPELVQDLIRGVKATCGESFPVTVKIRIDPDLQRTLTLVKTICEAGASILTIHGRTRHQTSSTQYPVDLDAIQFVASHSSIPVISNGDCFSLQDATRIRSVTGLKGVMSARGLTTNPGLFSGYDETPNEIIQKWITLASMTRLPFALYHRHLSHMLERRIKTKNERTHFNSLVGVGSILEYLKKEFGVVAGPFPRPVTESMFSWREELLKTFETEKPSSVS